MERKLLLLGLLQTQAMHGYQLNDVIDSHLGGSIQLKKATAYDVLKKMAAEGWITHREEREGNRPPRRVYVITPQGRAVFVRLLRESLARYEPAEFRCDIALAFLDTLPTEEALALLRQRRKVIVTLIAEADAIGGHPGSMQLVVEHQQRHLRTELDWLDDVIARVEAGELPTIDHNKEQTQYDD